MLYRVREAIRDVVERQHVAPQGNERTRRNDSVQVGANRATAFPVWHHGLSMRHFPTEGGHFPVS